MYIIILYTYIYIYIYYIYIFFSPEYLVMQWRNVEKIRITTVNHCILVVPHV